MNVEPSKVPRLLEEGIRCLVALGAEQVANDLIEEQVDEYRQRLKDKIHITLSEKVAISMERMVNTNAADIVVNVEVNIEGADDEAA